ncbi:MAG: phosphoribosylglycinamide formyltransferase [Saprospiraceae bacterium]|nr:phosphoribosylglycinamide formyltransferase [Saprospiraceae bacterium]
MANSDINIAIFASGTGSNANRIVSHFAQFPDVKVAIILSNRKDAKVLDMAEENGIETKVLERSAFYESAALLSTLEEKRISWIILAGFLWLVPIYLIEAYPNRILNIHPALLPKFGGKGMYGMHVHEAVKAASEKQSGLTIHYVNKQYDKGTTVFQASCQVEPADSAADIAHKVLRMEHRFYPIVIEALIQKSSFSTDRP